MIIGERLHWPDILVTPLQASRATASLFSHLRVTIDTLQAIVSLYRHVSKRVKQSPGLPVANSTAPFWWIPASPIQKEGSSVALPACVDVVIIGCRIMGTAFARTLLDSDRPLEVVMLEARDAERRKYYAMFELGYDGGTGRDAACRRGVRDHLDDGRDGASISARYGNPIAAIRAQDDRLQV